MSISDRMRNAPERVLFSAGMKVMVFLEGESTIRLVGICVDRFVPWPKLDALEAESRQKFFLASFLLQMCTAKAPRTGDKLNKDKQ